MSNDSLICFHELLDAKLHELETNMREYGWHDLPGGFRALVIEIRENVDKIREINLK